MGGCHWLKPGKGKAKVIQRKIRKMCYTPRTVFNINNEKKIIFLGIRFIIFSEVYIWDTPPPSREIAFKLPPTPPPPPHTDQKVCQKKIPETAVSQ